MSTQIFFLSSINEVEITSLLQLYPKLSTINRAIEQSPNRFSSDLNEYKIIVDRIDYWISSLYPDEQLIVRLRFFERYSYDHIAIECHYSNHSSISKKVKVILDKIKKIENSERRG